MFMNIILIDKEFSLPPSLTKEDIFSKFYRYKSSVNALDMELYHKFINIFQRNIK